MNSNNFSTKEIRILAQSYISAPYVTFEQIGIRYNITSRRVSNAIWKGIAENILSTNVCDAIYYKIINGYYKCQKSRIEYWDKAFTKRDEIREPIQKKLMLCVEYEKLLNNRLENYDEYLKYTGSPLSIPEINERLEKVRYTISRYNAFLK
jgi:hypothetical protein